MSAVDYGEYQRAVVFLEDQEAKRRGIRQTKARIFVAREVGVSPGTLENIRKGRLKGLKSRIERAIDDALIRFLTRQQEGLSHELAIAHARRDRSNPKLVAQATAARDALASLIEDIGPST